MLLFLKMMMKHLQPILESSMRLQIVLTVAAAKFFIDEAILFAFSPAFFRFYKYLIALRFAGTTLNKLFHMQNSFINNQKLTTCTLTIL